MKTAINSVTRATLVVPAQIASKINASAAMILSDIVVAVSVIIAGQIIKRADRAIVPIEIDSIDADAIISRIIDGSLSIISISIDIPERDIAATLIFAGPDGEITAQGRINPTTNISTTHTSNKEASRVSAPAAERCIAV